MIAETDLEHDRVPVATMVRVAAWVGLVANLVLVAVKLVAGVAGNSQAVVADAVHSATDVITDVALILGVRYWTAPADEQHPHGHRRIETLIAMSIGLLVGAVAVGIGWEAISGLGAAHYTVPGGIALAAAVLSIVVKEGLYRWTLVVARRTDSQALAANAWHHRSDALSSLPAAAAVAVAMLFPNLRFVDQVGAVVVAHFILFAAWRIVRPTLAQLIDEGAPRSQRREIEALALGVDGVVSAHALRTRFVGSALAVDLHVEVDGEMSVTDGYAIAQAVRLTLLEYGPKISDVLVQVEPYREGVGRD